MAVAANVVISGGLAFVLPGLLAALSLAIPPRARSTGLLDGVGVRAAGHADVALGRLIGDSWGTRWGITLLVPVFLLSAAW